MRRLLYISIIFMFITVVVGCGRGVDNRLVLADSLMWTAPDSSLAILNAVNRDSLQGDENLAYHALLLTQAQFRCNGNCTSDSLINNALDYYSDNHNREHYTRALLYKGAYYEFHTNQPVEAIKWYKKAEDNADTADYRNLAQINMRMGMLYYDNFASNNLDLEKFTKSQSYYEKLGDKPNILRSLLMSANVLRISDTKKANAYYDKAQDLAVELKDTVTLYSISINRAILCLKDSLYQESKECMIRAFALNHKNIDNYHYFIAAQAYAKLGDVDSAEISIKKADSNAFTSYDSVMFYKAMKELYIAKGEFAKANQYESEYHKISDSLEHNKEKYSINKFESDFDNDKFIHKRNRVSLLKNIIYSLIAAIVIIVAVLLYYQRKKRISSINRRFKG